MKNYSEFEGEQRTNKKGETYTIKKYLFKHDNKHCFDIEFSNGNIQMATYEQIKRGTCYDVAELKKQKRLKTEEKLRERNRLVKKAKATTQIPSNLNRCNVLSIDLSTTSTGIAYSSNGKLMRWKTIKADDKDPRERTFKIVNELVKILETGIINYVVLEDIYLSLNSNVLVMLAEARGMLMYHIQRLGIRLVLVPAVFWKMRTGNVPTERKEQKEFMKQRFFELTGVEADSDDSADAYMMLWACLKESEEEWKKEIA